METIIVKTKKGDVELAVYSDKEKDIVEDLSKTEDYGKIVDLVNEQKKNKWVFRKYGIYVWLKN